MVDLNFNFTQTKVLIFALDNYSRILSGQWNHISDFLFNNHILVKEEDKNYSFVKDTLEEYLYCMFYSLNYPRNGSMGIGNKFLDISSQRSYEILKVLQKAIKAIANEKEMSDLVVRYTKDPLPKVNIDGTNINISVTDEQYETIKNAYNMFVKFLNLDFISIYDMSKNGMIPLFTNGNYSEGRKIASEKELIYIANAVKSLNNFMHEYTIKNKELEQLYEKIEEIIEEKNNISMKL